MKRLLILAMFACPLTVRAGTCTPPAPCQPGDKVSVTIPPVDRTKFYLPKVTLVPVKGTAEKLDLPLLSSADSPTVVVWFFIPKEAPDGTYWLQITQKPKSDQPCSSPTNGCLIDDLAPSEVVIQSPSISAVSPTAAFAEDKDGNRGVNEVTIIGNGFRDRVSEFRFDALKTPGPCAANAKKGQQKPCLELSVKDGREIILSFYGLNQADGYYKGPQDFEIIVDGTATKPAKLTLIDTSASMPMTVALVGLGLIVVVMFLLIYAGRKIIKQTLGGKNYLTSALFVDVQTSSYSLSKCQFYAWTAAAVLGYLFLAISKSYVQGSATFPDIPSGLPGILLASAGTAVVSTGITSVKGNKGAGGPQPNFSDFITSGGVVAADRLQFAIWTIVGIGTFLSIVFQSDPRNINDLPPIPPGFLQLMGISSGGYLAGKLARKTGPTLDAMAISGTPDKLTFQLTGSGLSRSALFSIDDAPIFPDTVTGKDPSSKLPDVVQADATAGDPDLARILSFTVAQTRESWLGGAEKHNLTITNPDKQKATLPFQIYKVTAVTISGANQTLTITGEFLDKNLKVTYTKPVGDPIPVTNPQSPGPNQYTATVEPNLVGPVTVTISDTAGVVVIKANVPVT